jgi:hypothetical protein
MPNVKVHTLVARPVAQVDPDLRRRIGFFQSDRVMIGNHGRVHPTDVVFVDEAAGAALLVIGIRYGGCELLSVDEDGIVGAGVMEIPSALPRTRGGAAFGRLIAGRVPFVKAFGRRGQGVGLVQNVAPAVDVKPEVQREVRLVPERRVWVTGNMNRAVKAKYIW